MRGACWCVLLQHACFSAIARRFFSGKIPASFCSEQRAFRGGGWTKTRIWAAASALCASSLPSPTAAIWALTATTKKPFSDSGCDPNLCRARACSSPSPRVGASHPDGTDPISTASRCLSTPRTPNWGRGFWDLDAAYNRLIRAHYSSSARWNVPSPLPCLLPAQKSRCSGQTWYVEGQLTSSLHPPPATVAAAACIDTMPCAGAPVL